MKNYLGECSFKITRPNGERPEILVSNPACCGFWKCRLSSDVHSHRFIPVSFIFDFRVLNSIIMSVVIYPRPKKLLENVTLVFEDIKVSKKCVRRCVLYSKFVFINIISSEFNELELNLRNLRFYLWRLLVPQGTRLDI